MTRLYRMTVRKDNGTTLRAVRVAEDVRLRPRMAGYSNHLDPGYKYCMVFNDDPATNGLLHPLARFHLLFKEDDLQALHSEIEALLKRR